MRNHVGSEKHTYKLSASVKNTIILTSICNHLVRSSIRTVLST